jgi:methylated-DNA-protein-cysteine methyltransferase related protein
LTQSKKKQNSWEPIYRLIKRIPRGRVTTYGDLARALKVRGGARVVGYAMAGCPNGRGIPWHRVVGAGGRLIIRDPYGSKQRRLLESEGVEIGVRAIDMELFGWSPEKAKKKQPKARGGKRRKAQ